MKITGYGRDQYLPFRFKVTSILTLATTCLVLSVAGLIYPRALREQQEGIRRMVKAIAATSALTIDGDAHETIPPSQEALQTPAYQQLQQCLRYIQGSNPGVKYIWTMVKGEKPGETIIVGDIGGSRAEPGRRYDASSIPKLLDGFRGPTADLSPVRDPWGTSLSGYAPIRNSQGKRVAVLGVDMYGRELHLFREKFQNYLLLSLAAGLILTLILSTLIAGWISKPLDRLIFGMRQLEKGELYAQVALRTNDEFEEAAKAFNRMTSNLREAEKDLRDSFVRAAQSLMSALEAKDPYTRGHSESVTQYAVDIAKVMGKSHKEVEAIHRLAGLHDIGKIGIQDNILLKPGIFTKEERENIQNHPIIGAKILAPLRLPPEELALIADHHEREDGSGYPKGKTREELSDLVSIVSVADAFDAMTSNRPHQKAMKPADALQELRELSGTKFRREVVEALATVLKQKGFV
ncbi:MAG: HD domain-containing protein [Candidatus Omnitrophica bacterium]|nr:HD domain-containing protein [Candidatus Omnitrophota bacterium]